MRNYLKPLVLASSLCLMSKGLGAALSIQRRLNADFGGFLSGHDAIRDFIGTALSATLIFLLLQAICILLTQQSARGGMTGVTGLTVLDANYALAQLGERITLRMIRASTFDPLEASILAANIMFAALMAVFGFLEWRRYRAMQRSRAKGSAAQD